ncbi:hypothetical protein DNTS_034626, partial [Danionella cerebrum]
MGPRVFDLQDDPLDAGGQSHDTLAVVGGAVASTHAVPRAAFGAGVLTCRTTSPSCLFIPQTFSPFPAVDVFTGPGIWEKGKNKMYNPVLEQATPMERPMIHVALRRWQALAYTMPSLPHRYCSGEVTSGQKRLQAPKSSTFTEIAVWGSAVENQPSEECAIGYVLLGPCCSQTTTSTTVFPAHARHIEDLASSVLALLKPAVASWKKKRSSKSLPSESTQTLQKRRLCKRLGHCKETSSTAIIRKINEHHAQNHLKTLTHSELPKCKFTHTLIAFTREDSVRNGAPVQIYSPNSRFNPRVNFWKVYLVLFAPPLSARTTREARCLPGGGEGTVASSEEEAETRAGHTEHRRTDVLPTPRALSVKHTLAVSPFHLYGVSSWMPEVSVLYFAKSAELTGLKAEKVTVRSTITPLELWQDLENRHP